MFNLNENSRTVMSQSTKYLFNKLFVGGVRLIAKLKKEYEKEYERWCQVYV